MKKLLILFLLMSGPVWAEKYYVYIDSKSPVEALKAGHSARGQIIEVVPATPQYKPTKNELHTYQVVVLDLTKEEAASLRDQKYNLEKMSTVKQEQEISYETFKTNRITDSVIVER